MLSIISSFFCFLTFSLCFSSILAALNCLMKTIFSSGVMANPIKRFRLPILHLAAFNLPPLFFFIVLFLGVIMCLLLLRYSSIVIGFGPWSGPNNSSNLDFNFLIFVVLSEDSDFESAGSPCGGYIRYVNCRLT